jgi:hypothetical protein
MSYLDRYLAKFAGHTPGATYKTYETPGDEAGEFPRIYHDDPTKPTKPAEVPFDPEAFRGREPGDDDDRPTSQAWLAEFNRRIGRT